MFDREYPDRVLMSEWSDPSKSIPGGFHVDFLLAFGQPRAYVSLLRKEKERDIDPLTQGGCSFFSKEGKGNIREFLDTYLLHYEATKEHGFIGLPSGNHDSTRLAIGRGHDEIELVFALLMTMPGIPFIYNGDEIGLRQVHGLVSKEGGYSRTGARTPMQWDGSANAGFSTADPGRLYLPVDPEPGRPTVAEQEGVPGSLLNRVRQLAALRKANPTLCNGSFTPLFAEANKYPLVYSRADSSHAFVIAINPSASPAKLVFKLPQPAKSMELVMGNRSAAVCIENETCHLSMPGISYGIFRQAS